MNFTRYVPKKISVKPGDKVSRWLGGEVPMVLKVDRVENGVIYCGPWQFDENTGGEIDDGIPDIFSGVIISYITTVPENPNGNVSN